MIDYDTFLFTDEVSFTFGENTLTCEKSYVESDGVAEHFAFKTSMMDDDTFISIRDDPGFDGVEVTIGQACLEYGNKKRRTVTIDRWLFRKAIELYILSSEAAMKEHLSLNGIKS